MKSPLRRNRKPARGSSVPKGVESYAKRPGPLLKSWEEDKIATQATKRFKEGESHPKRQHSKSSQKASRKEGYRVAKQERSQKTRTPKGKPLSVTAGKRAPRKKYKSVVVNVS